MAKHIGDIEIGHRAAEEVRRAFKSYAAASRALGCNVKTVRYWENGGNPSVLMIARLNSYGCDVMYILTGNRK